MGKYIFICSAGHSGSTLLDLLIGSHSQVESLGEITQLPKNISLRSKCMCGQPMDECGFWKGIIDSMGCRLGVNLFSHPYALNLGFINARVIVDKRHQTLGYNLKRTICRALAYADLAFGFRKHEKFRNPVDEGIENNFLLYDTVLRLKNVACVVDSSKDYLKAVKLFLRKPDEVKIILLTRDGRGVFYSNLKRGRSKKKSIMPWINQNKRALELFKRYIPSEKYVSVKYEDLALYPQQTLRNLCDFLEIAYESGMLDYMNISHHILNGNNMRFRSTSEISLDEAWRSNLSRSDFAYFIKVGDLINSLLGYK
ncbi:sulfotransferase [Desulfococcus sp.]|uniref:sulfotransferase n=1 Tax=Desulfococcus sp. TaxID=2025834 RepID=UPI0035932E50